MSEEVICNITPPNSPTWVESHICQEENPDIKTYEQTLTSRWFVCLGEAKLEKLNLHDKSYVQNKEIHVFDDLNKNLPKNIQCKSITLFNNTFDMATMFLYESDTLFRLLRSEILYLHDAVKLRHVDLHTLADFHSTQDHLRARQNCVRLFLQLREYLSCLNDPRYGWIVNNALQKVEEQLNGFRLFLRRLSDLPDYVLHHCAHTQGEKCTEASYHLFHGQLDVLWLHLTSVFLVDRCQREATEMSASQPSSASSAHNTLDANISALVADLVTLSLLRFEKTDVRGLLIKSPFSCSCVAELWLLVIATAERLHSKGLTENFWTIFNKVMEEFLKPSGQNKKPNCRTQVRFVTHPCSNPFGFALWLLKHMAMIHSHDECKSAVPQGNHRLLDTVMKGLLSTDLSEAEMRVYLTLVERILIRYWEPDTKPIVLLWEHFQKRLNSTFYVPGSSVDSIAVVSQSVAGMIKQVKSRLTGKTNTDNSFQMFLRILGLHLQRVSTAGHSQHWAQLRGRVYSKLSVSKVAGLTETGLYHLVTLFLTLAVTADLSEVSRKLQSLLAGLPEDGVDTSARRLVWRSHLAVCLLLAERGQDVTQALTPLTLGLGQPQLDVTLYRTFMEGLRDLLDCSVGLKVDFTTLVGAWIPKFLADCSPNDSSRLLETLELLLLRVQSQPLDHDKFQSSVWQHLGAYLRRRVAEDSPPLQLADVCLRLCLPGWDVGREVVHVMLLNHTTHISLVRRFLFGLVQNAELLSMLRAAPPSAPEAHDVLIIRSWVRCSLLSVDFSSSELSRVTLYVSCLPLAADICMDLNSATDPLVHFIVNISNKSRATQDIQERVAVRQLMSRVLTGLDRWVESPLRQSQSQSQQLLSRVYHVVGLIVQLLPTFIYMKSRPNTVLKGLLDVMFLPHAAYKPDYDPPHKGVIAAELHLYLNGLMDLSKMHDGYIERCVEDLIKIYLPLVSSHSQCKLQECVQRVDKGVQLMLNTVCDTFIKRKTSSPQPHCAQALQFLRSVVRLYSRHKDVMLMFVDRCFEHVCDAFMFCDDFHHAKNIARDVIVSVFESPCFGDELSVCILQKFDNLGREYVPFFPRKLFSLFLEVLRHRPELVARFLPELLSHVRRTEEKRGRGLDQSLRLYVGELENALKSIRNGP